VLKSDLPNILIVDDLDENRLALQALLESLDANILCVDSARAAVNGFELAELMRGAERTRSVPIVFVTAGAPDSSWQFRGFEAGAVDFLFKPLDSRIVLSKVKVLLSIFRHRAELEEQVRISEAARERAESLNAKLEVETELRDRFVAALSHDLRIPLTAARLSAQMLEHLQAPDPATMAQYAQKVIRNMDRADRMITDLLDVSRVEAGKPIPLALEKVEVDGLFHRLKEDLGMMYGARVQIESQTGATGYWNADALRRVVENLVANAVKYGHATAPITVSARLEGGRARIRVHNTGNPIPLADQKHLFERFHRTGTAEKSGKRGWGIGLAICRGLVSSHAGSLSVSSDTTTGTTFTVDLPLDPRQEQDMPAALEAAVN
jgi:signal transduction histidine kinase